MTAVIRGVGTSADGIGTVAPGLPTGTAVGDLLLMWTASSGGTATASGWHVGLSRTNANGGVITMLWRIATGSDATTTNDPGDHIVAQIVGIETGTFKEANPFDAHGTNDTGGSSTTAVSLPSITTNGADRLILGGVAVSTQSSAGSWTNAGLTSVGEVLDVATTQGNDSTIAVVSGVKATAGSTGATTATLSVVGFQACVTVAINPVDDVSAEPLIRGVGSSDADQISAAITPTVPALTIPGDLLLCWCASEGLLSSSATGWTKHTTVNNGGSAYLVLFYKVAAGSDTISVTNTSNNIVGQIIGIQAGSYDSNWINASQSSTGSGSSFSITGSTTTASRCLVFTGIASSINTSASGWTNVLLAGLAEVIDVGTSLNGGSTIAVAAGLRATVANYGSTTGSIGSSDHACLSIAVKSKAQVVSLGTIATAESVHGHIVMPGLVLGTVATAESVEEPTVSLGMQLAETASTEALYEPELGFLLSPEAIVSGEEFYSPSLLGITTVELDETMAMEDVYEPLITLYLLPSTIGTEEDVYEPLITLHLLPSTIGTEEDVYEPELGLILYPGTIFDEVVYEPRLRIYMTLGPITSSEFVYSPSVGVIFRGFHFGGATRDARTKQMGTIGSSRGFFGFGPTTRRFDS